MIKIRCNVCLNEKNGFCTIKKIRIHANKKRKCDNYIYDSSKLKNKQKIPSVKSSYVEEQAGKRVSKNGRRETKKKLKELKTLVGTTPGNSLVHDERYITSIRNNSDAKYPITGDLSRFTTTAIKGSG